VTDRKTDGQTDIIITALTWNASRVNDSPRMSSWK